MKLIDYIKSNGKGRAAHSLERRSMQDQFLYDALEGYHSVEGNHAEVLERLSKKYARPKEDGITTPDVVEEATTNKILMPKTAPTRHHRGSRSLRPIVWSIAALFVLGLLVGGYFMLFDGRSKEVVLANNTPAAELPKQKEEPAILATPQSAVATAMQGEAASKTVKSGDAIATKRATAKEATTDSNYTETKNMAKKRSAAVAYGSSVMASPIKESNSLDEQEADVVNDLEEAKIAVLAYSTQNDVAIMPEYAKKQASKSSYIAPIADSAEPKEADVIAFEEYVKENRSKEIADSGSVVLSFKVSAKGKAKEIKIVASLSARANADAIRLVEGWQKWNSDSSGKIRTVTVSY